MENDRTTVSVRTDSEEEQKGDSLTKEMEPEQAELLPSP
jgi:hypothetical protein